MKVLVAILLAIAVVGFVVRPEKPFAGPTVPDAEKVTTISEGGESVEITDHLDPEGWTIVEFGAEW